jgi:filamentous hemagglutinin
MPPGYKPIAGVGSAGNDVGGLPDGFARATDVKGNIVIVGPNGAVYSDVAAAQKAAVALNTISVDSKGNALVGDWSSTGTLSAPENALGHWVKHSTEFPEFSNASQYVEAAQKFVTDPPVNILMKTRPNSGDVLLYDPASNTFAVKNATGAPKTMFRPVDGINYWNKQ